jgi:predicted transposase/invertase (TIGR01784 family)
LSAATELSVREAVVRNVELPMNGYNEKREQIDVNCKTDVGQAGVEMLASAMRGDSSENEHANAIERAVHNLCDLHSSQPGRGLNYSQLMPSFQIMICDYTILPGHKSFVNRYQFRNTVDGDTLSKSANIIFIELTKLNEVITKPVTEMTPLEAWAVFLKYGNDPKRSKLIEEITKSREGIAMANTVLQNISQDERQRAVYRSRRIAWRDREHDLAIARQEKEEAWQGGRVEERVLVAKNAITLNLTTEQIAKLTGLPHAEIEKLREKM